LTQASHSALKELRRQRQPSDNSMPDDFVLLVSYLVHQNSDGAKPAEPHAHAESRRDDLRPSIRERIDAAKKSAGKDIPPSDTPASGLLQNLTELEKAGTMQFYREALRLQIKKEDLVPTQTFAAAVEQAPPEEETPDTNFF
jgi:hypothetical protein